MSGYGLPAGTEEEADADTELELKLFHIISTNVLHDYGVKQHRSWPPFAHLYKQQLPNLNDRKDLEVLHLPYLQALVCTIYLCS